MALKQYTFKDVAKIYLPSTATPLDIEHYKYRGCNNWVFRIVVKKYAPKDSALDKYRKGIPLLESDKRYYKDEYYMGISDYFMKYDAEFEGAVEKDIGSSHTIEEARYRLEHYIDKHYSDVISVEDIV